MNYSLSPSARVRVRRTNGGTVAGCEAQRKHKTHFKALHSFPRPRIKHLQAKIREIGTNPPSIPVLGSKDGLRQRAKDDDRDTKGHL